MSVKLRKLYTPKVKGAILSVETSGRMAFLMNLSIREELHLFSQELRRHLSPHTLEQLARETGFVRRTSKYGAQDFVSLCVWLSHNIASTSLVQLCSRLEASKGVLMTAEGLNQRFNSSAVKLLQKLFTLLLEAEIGSTSSTILSEYRDLFRRIRIQDSTMFQIPNTFTSSYPGASGIRGTAGVKIQLEYDLYSGKFLYLYPGAGKEHDQTHGLISLQTIEPQDLYIRDLGYFSFDRLEQIQQHDAFYISRLKLNAQIYQSHTKNESDPSSIADESLMYTLLDLETWMNQMQPGEMIELAEAYVGKSRKLPARVILYRLTEEQTQKRQKDQQCREKKRGIRYTERTKKLAGLNVYITNIPHESVPKERIHDLYSLRWQIELLFKTWKSLFQIHQCKPIKQERFDCHLYGQLIAILLCSSTMFRMRELLLRKKQKELSEYKSIYMIQTYFPLLDQSIQQNTQECSKILLRLFEMLAQNGRKSRRYKKKTVFDILGVVDQYTTLSTKVA